MARTPRFEHEDKVANHADLREVDQLLRAAAKRLGTWWPQAPHPTPVIQIVVGDRVDTKTTEPKVGGGQAQVTVRFGIDAPRSAAIKHFVDRGYALEFAVGILLAHETFHCSQWRRARLCKARTWEVLDSGFAQGMEPGMSAEWKALANVLAAKFESRLVMTPPIIPAADIVSELRADLRAIRAAAALDKNLAIGVVGQDVLDFRQMDAVANGLAAYQIAPELQMFLTNFPSEADEAQMVWSWATQKLAQLTWTGAVAEALAKVAGVPVIDPRFVVNGSLRESLEPPPSVPSNRPRI